MRGKQFQCGGALACDDARIGVRMDRGGAGFGLQLRAHRLARGDGRRAAVQDRAVVSDRGELGLHRAFRHHHVAGNAAALCGQRQRGAMVAGSMGDHAARGGGLVQRPHRIAGAAELERADPLQVFAFELQPRAGFLIQRARSEHRGGMGMSGDARGGGEDVGEIRFQDGTHRCMLAQAMNRSAGDPDHHVD